MKKLALLFCSLLVTLASQSSINASSDAGQKPSPEEIITILKEGNKRFKREAPEHPNTQMARVEIGATEDQKLHTLATIISSSDSRVTPEIIFDQGIMDIFTIRSLGNVMDTDQIGSLEYGIAHLKTPLVVIMGNTQCEAATLSTAIFEGDTPELEYNIPKLIDNIYPAVEKAKEKYPHLEGEDLVREVVYENVYQGIGDTFMRSATAREYHKSGKAKIIGAVYHVERGEVEFLPMDFSDKILTAAEKHPNSVKEKTAPLGLAVPSNDLVKMAVVVNEQNPIANLSLRQIEMIFTGDAANWSTITGKNASMIVLTPLETQAPYDLFKEVAMRDRSYSEFISQLQNNRSILNAVSKNVDAIGFVPMPFSQTPGVKAISVRGTLPTAANYPLVKEVK